MDLSNQAINLKVNIMNSFNLRKNDFSKLSFNRKIDLLEAIHTIDALAQDMVYWVQGFEVEDGSLDWDFIGMIPEKDVSKGALWDYFSHQDIFDLVDLSYEVKRAEMKKRGYHLAYKIKSN
jgi:hypothetical protein